MIRKGTGVLNMLYQIEEPELTETQEKVLVCWRTIKDPKPVKAISEILNMSRDSVRARMHELKKLHCIMRP